MKLRVRYSAAALVVLATMSFLGWAWSNLVLVNIGLDLKYLPGETDKLLSSQFEWTVVRSNFGWSWAVSGILLNVLLIYRWFVVPSKG
jgi:hypothetical protein